MSQRGVDGGQRQEDAARPDVPAPWRSLSAMRSTWWGSSPTASAPSSFGGDLQRARHAGAEEGGAEALDAVLGGDLDDHDVAGGARGGLAVGQGLVRRQAYDLRPDAFDLHWGPPPWSSKKFVEKQSQRFRRVPSRGVFLPVIFLPVIPEAAAQRRLSGT
jgi:hypothetical protein